MSIARACYVRCDLCGDPAPVSTWDANDARNIASKHGWKKVGKQDICPRHIKWTTSETGVHRWHIEPWTETANV